jgi:23S rRNA (guanosine2251-2'-O)-methyltransferase
MNQMARNHPKRRNAHGPAGPGDAQRPRQDGPRERSHGGSGDGWLWGTHAVSAALANPSRTIHMLLATENAAARLGPARVTPDIILGKDLDNRLPPGAVHQGLAIKVAPLNPASLEDLIDRGLTRICVLDQVSDPHNLGAIYRSAAAFGFGGLVLQTRHAPPVTGVVAKSAAGAVETVAEARVVNIARALEQLGDAGFHTVGLAGEGRRNLADAVAGAAKVAIVLGAEGSGLRPAVAKACAELARIEIAPEMESLNVSNAAAIAFYEASRQRFPAG